MSVADATTNRVGADLYTEVLQFLYREARLLDEHRYEDWLALFTDDLIYEMPLTLTRERAEHERAYDRDMQYFADNIHSLRMRIARLGTDYAWAEDPPTRTRHLVLNVEVGPREDPAELSARSAFVVYASRGSRPDWDVFVGARHDVLVRAETGFRIRKRSLTLDQAVLGANSISIFL